MFSPPAQFVTRARLVAVAGIAASTIAVFSLTHGAHAQSSDGTLAPPTAEVPTYPVTPTTAAPTTTGVATSTAPPTTVATTSVPTTIVPTTIVSTTVPATTPPTTPPTTKKPGVGIVNANASGAVRIEVSISQQRLYLYRGDSVYRTVHVSTGSGRHYCEKGKCGVAHTPRGNFRIYNRISGWRTSALGKLYNPLYFSGGYAIHGARSVPNYPASHGCIRVSISDAGWLPRAIPNGTPVFVH